MEQPLIAQLICTLCITTFKDLCTWRCVSRWLSNAVLTYNSINDRIYTGTESILNLLPRMWVVRIQTNDARVIAAVNHVRHLHVLNTDVTFNLDVDELTLENTGTDLSQIKCPTKLNLIKYDDVAQSGALTNLRSLHMDMLMMGSFTGLELLTNLVSLEVSSFDVYELPELPMLQRLVAPCMCVNAALTNLTELDAVVSDDVLRALSLRCLTLREHINAENIVHMPLVELTLHTQIGGISELTKISTLRRLYTYEQWPRHAKIPLVTHLRIKCGSGDELKHLTTLTSLKIVSTTIHTFICIKMLTSLTYLSVKSEQRINMAVLTSLTDLRTLNANYTPVINEEVMPWCKIIKR